MALTHLCNSCVVGEELGVGVTRVIIENQQRQSRQGLYLGTQLWHCVSNMSDTHFCEPATHSTISALSAYWPCMSTPSCLQLLSHMLQEVCYRCAATQLCVR